VSYAHCSFDFSSDYHLRCPEVRLLDDSLARPLNDGRTVRPTSRTSATTITAAAMNTAVVRTARPIFPSPGSLNGILDSADSRVVTWRRGVRRTLLSGAVMKQLTLRETDPERFSRLISWLTSSEIGLAGASLAMSNCERGEGLFGDDAVGNGARVLVTDDKHRARHLPLQARIRYRRRRNTLVATTSTSSFDGACLAQVREYNNVNLVREDLFSRTGRSCIIASVHSTTTKLGPAVFFPAASGGGGVSLSGWSLDHETDCAANARS
jgi:hypothetical protein